MHDTYAFSGIHGNNMLIRALLIAITFHLSGWAGDVSPLARKAVAYSGMLESTREQLRLQLQEARKRHPDLPAETWLKAEAEIASPRLEDEMAALWQSNFTQQELKEVGAFLATPTGRKFFRLNQSLMPRLAASAALAGIRVFDVLQALHPDRFPRDPKKDAEVRRLFETMQKGSAPGGRK